MNRPPHPRRRLAIYAMLIAFAAFFLVPLVVVVLTSLRPNEEMAQRSLIGLPQAVDAGELRHGLESATASRSTARHRAVHRQLDADGDSRDHDLHAARRPRRYSLALWRFRGDTVVFALMTLGVFLPEQMRLIPWVIVLRDIGLSNTIAGLVLIHIVQGLSFTTLFCRNYYVSIPQDLMKAARIDGAGFFRIFWRIVLPLSPPILIVRVIWQFTGIWNEFLYGVTFLTGPDQPVTAALIAISAR